MFTNMNDGSKGLKTLRSRKAGVDGSNAKPDLSAADEQPIQDDQTSATHGYLKYSANARVTPTRNFCIALLLCMISDTACSMREPARRAIARQGGRPLGANDDHDKSSSSFWTTPDGKQHLISNVSNNMFFEHRKDFHKSKVNSIAKTRKALTEANLKNPENNAILKCGLREAFKHVNFDGRIFLAVLQHLGGETAKITNKQACNALKDRDSFVKGVKACFRELSDGDRRILRKLRGDKISKPAIRCLAETFTDADPGSNHASRVWQVCRDKAGEMIIEAIEQHNKGGGTDQQKQAAFEYAQMTGLTASPDTSTTMVESTPPNAGAMAINAPLRRDRRELEPEKSEPWCWRCIERLRKCLS